MVSNPAEVSLKSLTVTTLAEVFTQFIDNNLLRDDKGVVFSYGDVLGIAQSLAFQATRRRLVLCIIKNDIGGIAGYLALLAANAVPMMVSSTISETALESLIEAYQPDYVWLPHEDANRWPSAESKESQSGYVLVRLSRGASTPHLHENLALLISTSGSTGSAKYVRLSHQNIWSNAKSIADYLSLNADELAITTLPPSYSYGLSIIHSHLCVGAGLAVINKSLFEREFWNFMATTKATSFAGVPYHYEILKKLRFETMELPHLRTLTQAGGLMRPELTKEFANLCGIKGARFFTMYGQTEASPRMSFVSAEQAFAKAGTIGRPIPGGAMELQSETGKLIIDANVVGELVYRGPNVCLGYAESRGDLYMDDANNGVLYTGDLAQRDAEGFYTIVGRKKRFIKLFGNRINLQDVEQKLSIMNIDAACSGRDDVLEVYLVSDDSFLALEVKKELMSSMRIGVQSLAVYGVGALPRSESGKVSYSELHPKKAQLLA